MNNVRIVATGAYSPRTRVDNSFFREKLGLTVNSPRQRGHASPEETSVMMGTAAVQAALANAGLNATDVDLLVSFSGMGDFEFPKDANAIQVAAGLSNATCWSIDTACASFISGMKCAYAQLRSGLHRRALVLTAMNWVNRGIDQSRDFSSIGDGAAAVVLEAVPETGASPAGGAGDGLIGVNESTRGEFFEFITLPSPFATGAPDSFHFSEDTKHGRFLASGSLQIAKDLLVRAGLTGADVDWFIAHQPGERLPGIWAKALGIASAKILHTFDENGNMSAVNIPFTLHEYSRQQARIKRGDRILFFAPGAGLHVAAMLWQF